MQVGEATSADRCLRPAEQAFGWEEAVATSSSFYPPTLSHGGPSQTKQSRLKRLLLSLEWPRLDENLGLTTGLALFLISFPISSKKIKEQKIKHPECHILHTLSLQSEIYNWVLYTRPFYTLNTRSF